MAYKSHISKVISIGIVFFITFCCTEAFAQRHLPTPLRCRILVSLPKDHKVVRVHGKDYFYHLGIFYKKGSGGFVVVGAPVGAVLKNLPAGYRTVVSLNVTYYYLNGVYYKRTAEGYRVVKVPRKTVITGKKPNIWVPTVTGPKIAVVRPGCIL